MNRSGIVMSNLKDAVLGEMGIKPLWRLRAAVQPAPESAWSEKQDEFLPALRAAPVVVLEGMPSLDQAAKSSSGGVAEEDRPARLPEQALVRVDCLFVADGAAQLPPLAAKLLEAMLAAIGLKRGENVLLADTAQGFSAEQVGQIKPRLVVALGWRAAQGLLGVEGTAEMTRGHLFHCQGVPLIVSDHPEDLLSHPERKARVWEDLCFVQDQLV